MSAFRTLAEKLFRRELSLVVAAMGFALVSAGGLGVGIIAILPVLQTVLNPEQRRGLPELVARLDAHPIVGGRIPDAWIAALPPGPFTAVVWIVAGLAVLTVVGAAANFLHQQCSLTAVHRSIATLREEVFARVVRFPLRTVVRDGPTDAVSRIVNDTEALALGLNTLLSKVVAQLTKGVASFLAALWLSWSITLAAVIVAPVLYVVLRKIGKRIRRASRSALTERAGLYRAATEALQGLRVVKVHHTEAHEAGRFRASNRELLRHQLRVRTMRALASPLTETLTAFALGALTLVAVKLILDGHLEPSRFLMVLAALGSAGASLKPLTGLVNDIQASSAAADRVQELLDTPEEPGLEPGRPGLPRHARSIAFEGVSLTYRGSGRAAIDGITLAVPFGSTVAFVGPNGSGKTTLLSMVPRLFDPDSGRVLVDGTDISTVSLGSLRGQIGVVTQETVLFRRSVRENIAYGLDIPEEDILDAIRRARADDIIARLPQGMDTVLAEGGLSLSGGQRQRLAIARAILRDPSILILDEATSMIDAESEARIADALTEFSRGRTCLIVAHRLSTVVHADRIVVMDEGRVVDSGRHDELLGRCELYQNLARHQLISTA